MTELGFDVPGLSARGLPPAASPPRLWALWGLHAPPAAGSGDGAGAAWSAAVISACLSPTGHRSPTGRSFVPTCSVLTTLPRSPPPGLRLPRCPRSQSPGRDHSSQSLSPEAACGAPGSQGRADLARAATPPAERPRTCPASPRLPSCSPCSRGSGRPPTLLPSHSRSCRSFHPGSPSRKPMKT